jgi:hypothetical protein
VTLASCALALSVLTLYSLTSCSSVSGMACNDARLIAGHLDLNVVVEVRWILVNLRGSEYHRQARIIDVHVCCREVATTICTGTHGHQGLAAGSTQAHCVLHLAKRFPTILQHSLTCSTPWLLKGRLACTSRCLGVDMSIAFSTCTPSWNSYWTKAWL